ncbi:MAG TPA: GFA family protein [Solirubrobacterales bacterium]|nr:GFA family protein [Solirubrobacterales bacterium]
MESSGDSPDDQTFERLTGGCMCGAVKFELDAPLFGAAFCWCKRCQRRTGTAFSTTALTRPGSFNITEGAELIGTHEPGDGGWNKSFCTRCGSQIHTTNADDPDLVAVRMGAFDEDPGVRPGLHQFVSYAPSWYAVPDDGLPRFPERLDWNQVDAGS